MTAGTVLHVAHVVDERIGLPRTPWADFADGRVWELERGVDYVQDDERARRAAMAWAQRHDVRIRTSVVSPGRLRIQILPKSGLRDTA